MSDFPPIHWNYNKIIAGSQYSIYDFEYISKFNFEKWMNIIGNTNLFTISIEDYLMTLCEKHIEYCKSGIIEFNELYDLINKLNDYISTSSTDLFFRLSYRSAKDVPEGRMPITNGKQIINAIIKSERCFYDLIAHKYHKNKGLSLTSINIILIPWKNCNQSRELRCFVYNKQLVAITNQFPNETWSFNHMEDYLISKINTFINDLWSNNKDLYNSCVVDIEIDKFMNIDLIEFNPYEKKGSTSAILFDWINDKDILFNNNNKIILRH